MIKINSKTSARSIRVKQLHYKRWGVFFGAIIGIWIVFVLLLLLYSSLFKSKNISFLSPKIEYFTVKYLKQKIESEGYKVSFVKEIEGNTVISVQIDNGPLVFFSRANDVSLQIIAMDEIIKKMRIDNKKIQSIDLRFDKPIVKL